MENERWLRRGVPPFAGSIDDWPADDAWWLDRVLNLREQAAIDAQHDQKTQAEYEQWQANRKGHK